MALENAPKPIDITVIEFWIKVENEVILCSYEICTTEPSFVSLPIIFARTGDSIQSTQQVSAIRWHRWPTIVQQCESSGHSQHLRVDHNRAADWTWNSRYVTANVTHPRTSPVPKNHIIAPYPLNANRQKQYFHSTVAQLSDVIARKDVPNIPMRTIKIPGAPYMLALSCDHETLSVCYTMNGSSFIDLYSVRSFLSIVRVTLYRKNSFCFCRIVCWSLTWLVGSLECRMHAIESACVECGQCESESNPLESDHRKYHGTLLERWHAGLIRFQGQQLRI